MVTITGGADTCYERNSSALYSTQKRLKGLWNKFINKALVVTKNFGKGKYSLFECRTVLLTSALKQDIMAS